MNPTIDFSKLSLQDALDLAILIEEEARDRYQEFVDQLELHHTPQAASFFRFMAENETKHGEELSMRRQLLFADAATRVSRSMLWDVEAPDYDESRAFMSVRQAMNVAMACEIKAHDFFDSAIEHIDDPEVRSLFEELRDEEVEHKRLVNEHLTKLPPDPETDTEDYEDEPVAQ
jgi:erythrin-vacuolar iron transport family protein